ncbi:MAG: F0F1 ATP synthase subunit A [Clostridia bacterium]|nr:F0F1 ATP synthase subunit A [Clostridia bacterium]
MTENLLTRVGLASEELTVTPHKINFFGLEISETIVAAWVVMLIIILFALVVRIFIVKRFKTVPKGLQNVLEMIVGFFEKFAKSTLGKSGSLFAAYIFTVAIMIFCTSLVELFGVRAPATDLNFTIALAGMSFILINAFGIWKTGVIGRLRWFVKPKAFMLPINIVTHAVIPVSMAFRLFGNMFAGLVVMNLLYSEVYLQFGLPGIVSIYFNLFHVGIQTYIFLILTLSFMEETTSYGAKKIFKSKKKKKLEQSEQEQKQISA